MALSANRFGSLFSFTGFGESHGPAIGVLIEGVPAGLEIDLSLLKQNLQRRRPGNAPWVSQRNELDEPRILSGVFEGKSLGTPIAVVVDNLDARSGDYSKPLERRGHADDLWAEKFGHSDPRGGGRASGRETLSRVLAGSFAQMIVRALSPETRVFSWAESIGEIALNSDESTRLSAQSDPVDFINKRVARFPGDEGKQKLVEQLLSSAKHEGRSYGGTAKIKIEGLPAGLGQPVFHKLKGDFSTAFMSIGATLGFELGAGFGAVKEEGSVFHSKATPQSVYGGIRGGISSGEPIEFSVAFKPTSSVMDIAKKGRHDPCIVPRAIPVLEAMAFVVLADHMLWKRLDKI